LTLAGGELCDVLKKVRLRSGFFARLLAGTFLTGLEWSFNNQ
jgi:hypothetical protein